MSYATDPGRLTQALGSAKNTQKCIWIQILIWGVLVKPFWSDKLDFAADILQTCMRKQPFCPPSCELLLHWKARFCYRHPSKIDRLKPLACRGGFSMLAAFGASARSYARSYAALRQVLRILREWSWGSGWPTFSLCLFGVGGSPVRFPHNVDEKLSKRRDVVPKLNVR